MSFKALQLECEILTKFKPSLVCTINGKDIVIDENKIKFSGMGLMQDRGKIGSIHIGTTNRHHNLEIDHNIGDYDTSLWIKSAIRPEGLKSEDRWSREEENPHLLSKIKISHNTGRRWTENDVDEDRFKLTLQFNHKGRFSSNNLVITKSLIAGNLPIDVMELFDKMKDAEYGAKITSEDMEFQDSKMDWRTRYSSGGGHDRQQIELKNKDTSFALVESSHIYRDDKISKDWIHNPTVTGNNLMRLMRR